MAHVTYVNIGVKSYCSSLYMLERMSDCTDSANRGDLGTWETSYFCPFSFQPSVKKTRETTFRRNAKNIGRLRYR